MPGGDADIYSKAGKIQIQVQNTILNIDTKYRFGYRLQIRVYNSGKGI